MKYSLVSAVSCVVECCSGCKQLFTCYNNFEASHSTGTYKHPLVPFFHALDSWMKVVIVKVHRTSTGKPFRTGVFTLVHWKPESSLSMLIFKNLKEKETLMKHYIQYWSSWHVILNFYFFIFFMQQSTNFEIDELLKNWTKSWLSLASSWGELFITLLYLV